MTHYEEEQNRNSIDIKAIIVQYIKYWPYYLLCVAIALIIAKLNLRYATRIYQSTTNVKILDQFSSGDVDLSGLNGSGGLLYRVVNLNNEIEILRSRRLMENVVEDLRLQTRYFDIGQVRTSEIWQDDYPFIVAWDFDDSVEMKRSPMFKLTFVGPGEFTVATENSSADKIYKFKETITFSKFSFKLFTREGVNYKKHAKKKREFGFQYIPAENLTSNLARSLSISVLGKTSQIVSISVKGPLMTKNEAILNNVVEQFNRDGIEDKQRVAKSTENFVNQRLMSLVSELDTIEQSLADYQRDHSKTTIQIDPDIFSKDLVETETLLFQIETQLSMARGYLEILVEDKKYTILPEQLGLDNNQINLQTAQYNQLILSRDRALVGATEANPVVQQLNSQISNLKQSIIEGLKVYIQAQKDLQRELMAKESAANARLSTIPEIERTLRDISRQQGIKERLYLFLLEKREAASLSAAVTSPSVKVVDYAFSNKSPVSPKPQFTYLVAIFLGLVIPIGWVYVRSFFNTRLHTSTQIRKLIGTRNLPIIGEIPLIEKETPRLIQKHDRSELAEAFRVVRTNLNYIKKKNPGEEAQIIMVTSSTKSEGKTFTSLNTALSFASSGFKVLLVGADLRNPQLHSEMGIDKSNKGLTSYLFDEQSGLDELLLKDALNQEHLDIIISGFIPPNPAELLMNGRFEQFISESKKKYDYVILDCAPTLLVTDTLLLAPFADLTMYVVRSEVTEIRILEYIYDLERAKKLPKISMVINGLGKSQKFGYGYGYGYNYGYGYRYGEEAKKTGWRKAVDTILRRNK